MSGETSHPQNAVTPSETKSQLGGPTRGYVGLEFRMLGAALLVRDISLLSALTHRLFLLTI